MESELGRTIPFNQNPANAALSINAQASTLQATTTVANAAGTAAASGAATTAATTTSTVGAFLASKAGIVLLAVVGTAVVATAVVVPVVVTQTGDDEPITTDISSSIQVSDIATNLVAQTTILNNNVPHSIVITTKPEDDEPTTEVEVEPSTIKVTTPNESGESGQGGGEQGKDNQESGQGGGEQGEGDQESGQGGGEQGEGDQESGQGGGEQGNDEPGGGGEAGVGDGENGTGGETHVEKKYKQYFSKMFSLTQNNFLEYSRIITNVERNIPTTYGYEEVNIEIKYGGDNKAIDDKYDEILAENNKLIPSSTTYDEIGSDGKLYLKKNFQNRKLYKHIFSKGLYGGDVSNNEKAVKKVIKINPISTTNYITGLYAPPGEIITIEISQTDLDNIGGSLTFLIGHYTHNNIISINSASIGIKRVPNLYSTLVISKTTGYIGSFLGGPIYISNPSKIKKFTVTISGAVPYKHILFGITTREEFESMKDYTAPFFELDVRDSIRYSGGLTYIKDYDYDNLMDNLIFWDKCVRTSRQVPTGSNINLGIHFLFDPCINSKGALALAYVGRNWCQVPPSFAMALDFETATKYGVWGHIHELNHHFQRYGFNSVSNEVTNNVINIVEYILYTQLSGLRNAYSNAALTKISGNHNYMNPEYSLNNLVNNPPAAADEIRFYEPIIQAFGPHLFLKVTKYGNGRAGVDLFYESLVKVIHYDFTYYIEKVLNLVISESKKIEMKALKYHIFVPITTIFQTGRYYTFEGTEQFSNTSYPYRIPRGGATKLDFQTHLIYPKGFEVKIESISQPAHGTLTKLSDFVYTYKPDNVENLSGRMNMILSLKNTEESIDTKVALGLEFEVDNSQSVQTNYIFDSVKYTDLDEAIDKNFEGYSNIEFFPNFAGAMTGIKEGNVGVWEGKFRVDDDGYKYILFKGGRGPSKLFAKFNGETNYNLIGYITINQGAYMFAHPSYSYYQKNLKKGDIVYFKAYLLGKTLATGASASLYIGLAKEEVVSKVKTLGSNDIVGLDSQFDVKYTFNSGDPYYSEKKFDSLSFFDYSLVSVSSNNFHSWDGSSTNGLEKLIDRNSNTYIHTKKNTAINANNPLTIIFDLGRSYYYDYIYFVKKGPNNYAPKTLLLSTSDDNVTWVDKETITTVVSGDLVELNLREKLHSRYVKMHITETTSPVPGYIALISVEFIEKNVNYALKNPEKINISYCEGEEDHVLLNYDNFPYFGHSYILKTDTSMTFEIINTTGIRIKTCHKSNAKIEYVVNKGTNTIRSGTINIDSNEEQDFPIIVTGLTRDDYNFVFKVIEGSFDLEYLLYEI